MGLRSATVRSDGLKHPLDYRAAQPVGFDGALTRSDVGATVDVLWAWLSGARAHRSC